ncbi:MAG: hypothetical protein AUG51_16670 [Acidobacteria bacterium 13_1_20CM_3_53_8]|nr:MAG: hypothetical protein AUG51_16670 [Acidobacteria bacterium 13_1_20CM_3_53_8]
MRQNKSQAWLRWPNPPIWHLKFHIRYLACHFEDYKNWKEIEAGGFFSFSMSIEWLDQSPFVNALASLELTLRASALTSLLGNLHAIFFDLRSWKLGITFLSARSYKTCCI